MRKMALSVVIALVLTVLSTPAEAAWTFERLSDNTGTSYSPRIGASGTDIHVVWYDDSFGGNYEIFYKRSTNNGSTWSFQRLTDNSGSSKNPAIAVSGSTIHVAWHDRTFFSHYGIFYKRSTDRGNTWSFQRITSNTNSARDAAISVSGTNVCVVWTDYANYVSYEICSKRSTDNGSTWAFKRLTDNSGNSYYPSVAVSGTSIHVVWYDGSYGGNYEIFYKRSTNNGSSWSFQRLTSNSGSSYYPRVALSGSNLHLVWHDDTFQFGYPEIFYKKSTNNGSSWSFQRLTTNSGSSFYPDVSASGINVRVVWGDLTYGNREIFYKSSSINGSSWSFQRLTSNSGTSSRPAVAVSGSAAHVVWYDNVYGGNDEIFYKRGP
jgi:BNR repeat-like domain